LEELCIGIGLLPKTCKTERQFIYGATGLMLCAIEDSTLLANAPESDLEAGRHFTSSLLDLFHATRPQEANENGGIEKIRLAETIGAPIFLYTLLMLRMRFKVRLNASQQTFASVGPAAKQAALRLLRQEMRSIWAQ